MSKVSDQIASWDTGSETGTKAVLLHPFKPLICIADEKETIRYCLDYVMTGSFMFHWGNSHYCQLSWILMGTNFNEDVGSLLLGQSVSYLYIVLNDVVYGGILQIFVGRGASERLFRTTWLHVFVNV